MQQLGIWGPTSKGNIHVDALKIAFEVNYSNNRKLGGPGNEAGPS